VIRAFVILIMAWRLHEHVLRGKIDNRTRGRVSGEIWLAGIGCATSAATSCNPIEKRAHDASRGLLDELRTTECFPEEGDEQVAYFVSAFMNLSAKLVGALGGVARGDDFF
jgi:hypothetical protein